MTADIERLPKVEADLQTIFDYIAQFDPDAAERLIYRINASIERLRHAPETGTLRPDIASEARSKPVGAYLVLFRSTPERVTIVGVVHGSRDLPTARAAFN